MTRYATGQPVPRVEDPRLLTGRGRFTDDFNLSHQAYAAMVRSPHPHAGIRGIHREDAAAAPGVLAVLTGADLAADGLGNLTGPSPRSRRDGSPMFRPPRPALTADRVRHPGQIVAVVVADSPARARDAAERVEVDYEPLPFNVVTGTATDPDTPPVWDECPDNESFFLTAGDGDAVDAALAAADHVVRQRFVVSRVSANSIEPRGVLGHFDPGEGRYTIYVGHQRPYAWRTNLAKNVFRIPENRLRLVTGDVGGSFGMKGAIYPEVPLVAWASKRVGRPVKWIADRSESLLADDHGRDNVTEAALALDDDGRFLALDVRTVANLGAYVSYLGFAPSTANLGGLAGVYTIPAIRAEVSGVLTNTSPISPYRGAGRPEASLVVERMIHIAAGRLGVDPVELRRRNFIPPSAMPYRTALTFTYDSGDFEGVMDRALAEADHAGFAARRAASAERGRLRGIGVACTIEQAAAPQTETAELRFDPSGTATLLVGTTPHGQGHATIYTQLVCERLGLDPGSVRVVEGDTDKVSFGTGTGGSRSATIGTGAVLAAVEKIEDKGRRIAAHLLEAAEPDVALADGAFEVRGTDRRVELARVVAAAFDPGRLPPGMEPGLYEIATYAPERPNFPNGCHVCEVEVNPETGEVEIVRYTAVGDVGTELNPLLVQGQIRGGVVQGAGQALMERVIYDPESGGLVTGSFLDYPMPRAGDLCAVDTASHPVPTATNPLGVKGAGEAGTVGGLPAVMNAVNDALAARGIEHLEMPATPERVWRALREADRGPAGSGR